MATPPPFGDAIVDICMLLVKHTVLNRVRLEAGLERALSIVLVEPDPNSRRVTIRPAFRAGVGPAPWFPLRMIRIVHPNRAKAAASSL